MCNVIILFLPDLTDYTLYQIVNNCEFNYLGYITFNHTNG